MFDVVKGDKDNLEGKALFYASKKDYYGYIAIAIAPTISEAVGIMVSAKGIPEDKANRIISNMSQSEVAAKHSILELARRMFKEEAYAKFKEFVRSFRPVYCIPFSLEDIAELEFYKLDCDVIDAGEVRSGGAQKFFEESLEGYLHRYLAQRKHMKKEQSQQNIAAAPNYRSLPKDETHKRFRELASELNYCVETKSSSVDARGRLLAFFDGAPFIEDVKNYCAEIAKNKNDNELAGYLYQRIAAIVDENFEKAASLTKKINSLLKTE